VVIGCLSASILGGGGVMVIGGGVGVGSCGIAGLVGAGRLSNCLPAQAVALLAALHLAYAAEGYD